MTPGASHLDLAKFEESRQITLMNHLRIKGSSMREVGIQAPSAGFTSPHVLACPVFGSMSKMLMSLK